jgi:hypothetical protein
VPLPQRIDEVAFYPYEKKWNLFILYRATPRFGGLVSFLLEKGEPSSQHPEA